MGRLRRKSALTAGLFLCLTCVPLGWTQAPPAGPLNPRANSQIQDAEPTFSISTRLVTLLVTVKNQAGDLIGTLDRGNFAVTDKGVKQEIAIFEHQTAQPLSVSLLLDTSWSTKKDLKLIAQSAGKFLDLLVREGNTNDAAALYTFSYQVTLQNSFTRRVARIEDNLQKLESQAGTSLYDAVYFASRDFGNREGRHVIVTITDGTDTTSARKYREAVEAAQRADAVVYPIVIVPISASAGRNTGGEHALETIAQSTGGKAYYPTIGGELDRSFNDILRELRTQYLIGYYPRGIPSPRGGFHLVRVQIPEKNDLRISTRTGYYEDNTP
jgi:Ca-activated chloride channel family protein